MKGTANGRNVLELFFQNVCQDADICDHSKYDEDEEGLHL